MEIDLRRSGIAVLGNLPWTTHLCQFYNTKQELIEIVAPFIRAGLESSEFCLWVISEALTEKEGLDSVRTVIPDVDDYINSGQFTIVSHDKWHSASGRGAKKTGRGIERIDLSGRKGYEGARIAGDATSLEKENWQCFVDYRLTSESCGKRIITLCTYSLTRMDSSQTMDVLLRHESALVKREGLWRKVERRVETRESDRLKETEGELLRTQQQNDFLAKIIELTVHPFVVGYPNGRVATFNKAFEELTGYGAEELETIHWERELTPPEWRGLERKKLEELRLSGKPVPYEKEFVRKDGSRVAVELLVHLVTGSEGKPLYYYSFITDITERKRVEGRLREREIQYRLLFESNPNPMLVFDEKTLRILAVNDTAMNKYGWSREEFLAMTILDLRPAKEREKATVVIRQHSSDQGETSIGVVRHYRKDGSPIKMEITASSISFEGRSARLCTMTDVTERESAGEMLRQQADMMDLAYEAMFAFEVGGPIVAWNLGASQLYGFAREEALGRFPQDLLHAVFPESFDAAVSILRQKGTYAGELVHTAKDGRAIVVESRMSLISYTSRKQIILEINRDITEQRRLEGQLRQAQKLEAIGTLTAGIAHDFNNILAAIVGFGEIAISRLREGTRERASLERILEAGMRGRDLVKRMMTFSRRGEQEKKPCRLSSVVEEALGLVRTSIPSTVDMRVEIESETGLILADPLQLQQVIMNLCMNAAHAMRNKGGLLHIGLSDLSVASATSDGVEPGSYMKLVVSDTGEGIPPGIAEKIFDPFFTTKAPGEGTGLGLSVVHGIVKGLGGHITVRSKPGSGTAFTLYFPKTMGGEAAAFEANGPVPTGREKILFVDDEEALAEMGAEILGELGYDVVSATSATEAFALLKKDPARFDLVVTDQTMPGMTGLDLAREVLALRPGIPIILCSGFSHVVNSERAAAAHIAAVVMKPLTKREIAVTIRSVLDR